MRIQLLAVADRPPPFLAEAAAFYADRLPREYRLSLEQVSPAKGANRAPAQRMAEEAERLEKKLKEGTCLIALDRTGRAISSENLAERLNGWLSDGRDLAFLIGGADGLHPELAARAAFRWSLSPLTFPHHLARVLVLEQLYRAHTILTGHPYHTGH